MPVCVHVCVLSVSVTIVLRDTADGRRRAAVYVGFVPMPSPFVVVLMTVATTAMLTSAAAIATMMAIAFLLCAMPCSTLATLLLPCSSRPFLPLFACGDSMISSMRGILIVSDMLPSALFASPTVVLPSVPSLPFCCPRCSCALLVIASIDALIILSYTFGRRLTRCLRRPCL